MDTTVVNSDKIHLNLNAKHNIHALSLKEYNRELLDMDFRFGLNDFRAKLNSMGRLSVEEECNFMAYIEFSTMCYAIDANKDGLFESEFRERTRNALIAHYTSRLLSDSQLAIISQLLHLNRK